MVKERFKTVSHSVVSSNKCVSERIIELGTLCVEANELLSEATKGNESKLRDLALKCVEISLFSDSISYELYLSNQVKIEELEKVVKEAVKIL